MIDGAASLMSVFYGLLAASIWQHERASNLLDGGAPFYRPYETSDGKHVFVAAIEPQFYLALLNALGIADLQPEKQHDRATWPAQEKRLTEAFMQKSRDDWSAIFACSDACVSPVLSLTEAPQHPHNLARQLFIEIDGVVQPGPAPRFSRTPSTVRCNDLARDGLRDTLKDSWGLDKGMLESLLK